MNNNYLDQTFVVSSYDIDVWGYLKPTTILKICQDVAYLHSSERGMGFDTLLASNMTWVLSRIKVQINRVPAWHDSIRVRTWHKGQSGIFSLRDYIFYDLDDNPIIRVTTSWLIINIESRRISRVDRVFNQDGALSLMEHHHDAIDGEAERIESPADPHFAGEHRVRYSDMDVNHHVNNAKYLEWACDISTKQMQQEYRLKSLTINFNHEAKFDEVVTLSASDQSQERVVIEGTIDKKSIFAVALEYR